MPRQYNVILLDGYGVQTNAHFALSRIFKPQSQSNTPQPSNSRLPQLPAQQHQLLIQGLFRLQRHLPALAGQLLRVAQLQQDLQLLIAVLQLLLVARLLDHGDDGVRPGHEEVKVARAARQHGVVLDVLEVLLDDEHVQLEAVAAVRVHGFDVEGVGDEEGVDEETETGDDEAGVGRV